MSLFKGNFLSFQMLRSFSKLSMLRLTNESMPRKFKLYALNNEWFKQVLHMRLTVDMSLITGVYGMYKGEIFLDENKINHYLWPHQNK